MSRISSIFTLIRAAGANSAAQNVSEQTGICIGGIYVPAHTSNGEARSARWEGSFYHNIPGRDGRPDQDVVVKITAWNGRNAKPGKGLADMCAKWISMGKEICCEVDIVSYKSRIFVDGQPVINSAGVAHMEPKLGFRMRPGTLQFGRDGQKALAMEIQKWNQQVGQQSFFARPPQWNVVGTQDQITWSQGILPWRSAQVYTGGNTFGCAKVVIPEGVILADGITGTTAGTGNANSGVVRTAEGYTIEQYRAAKWTDVAMIADPRFACFIQAGLLGNNLSAGLPDGPSGPQGPPAGAGFDGASGAVMY